MSNTDRIAQILRERLPLHLTAGGYVGVPELAAAIDAELHPVIETVEQLDALPMGSVIRGKTSSYERFADGHWWRPAAHLPVPLSALHVLVLPARVLYTPEAGR